jgi:hypothetical protein
MLTTMHFVNSQAHLYWRQPSTTAARAFALGIQALRLQALRANLRACFETPELHRSFSGRGSAVLAADYSALVFVF